MKTPVLLPVMTGLLALAGSGVAHAQDEQGRVISSTPINPLDTGGWSPGRRWVCQVIARLTVGSGFVSGQSPSPGRGVAKMCGSYAVRK